MLNWTRHTRGSIQEPSLGDISSLPSRTREPASIRTPLLTFSSHFSQPRKLARARDWVLQPSTEWSNRAAVISGWKANQGMELHFKSSCRELRRQLRRSLQRHLQVKRWVDQREFC